MSYETSQRTSFRNYIWELKNPLSTIYKNLRLLKELLNELSYTEYDNGDKIIPPQYIKPNSVIIFDDVASYNQNIN